jgi:CubicO group peptidase (beta-lactamase class C family)
MTDPLSSRIDAMIEETGFSGAVSVARGGRVVYARAAGLSDRAHGVPNTLETRFAVASGTKGLTALAVMSLVADGALALDAAVSSLLGAASELVDPAVTLRQLLAHTSGVGDYLDEAALTDIEDYVLTVPVHRLACPADFVPVLRGRPAQFAPGARFAYSNSGYVLLALIIEARTGRSYYDVVHERVCLPGGMRETAFLRLDELPGSAAIGYLPGRGYRTNHLHLPVRGAGDGGVYTTAGDLARLWTALFGGGIVPRAVLEEMLRPQHEVVPPSRGYGLGVWLVDERGAVEIEGSDPGISFRSRFEPGTGLVFSVLSNTTTGAWPIVKALGALL